MPARIARIGVGCRVHSVVVVARVAGIDRQQRHVCEIGAAATAGFRQLMGLALDGIGKSLGQTMRVDRDQADLALVLRIAERLDDPRAGRRMPPTNRDVEAHEIAVRRIAVFVRLNFPVAQLLAVDRQQMPAAAFAIFAVDAEQSRLLARQLADRLGEVLDRLHLAIFGLGFACLVRFDRRDAGQDAVAYAEVGWQHRPHRIVRLYPRARPFARLVPRCGFGDEIAFRVPGNDLEHRDGRQPAALLQRLAIARDGPLARKLCEQPLQLRTIVAPNTERPRDLALADLAFGFCHEAQQLFPAGQAASTLPSMGLPGWSRSLWLSLRLGLLVHGHTF